MGLDFLLEIHDRRNTHFRWGAGAYFRILARGGVAGQGLPRRRGWRLTHFKPRTCSPSRRIRNLGEELLDILGFPARQTLLPHLHAPPDRHKLAMLYLQTSGRESRSLPPRRVDDILQCSPQRCLVSNLPPTLSPVEAPKKHVKPAGFQVRPGGARRPVAAPHKRSAVDLALRDVVEVQASPVP